MIYFIRAGDDGPVKIGVSENATQRVADLRTANPAKLSVIRLIEGGRLQERALHMEFRNLRIQGEWFKFDPRMLEIDPSDIDITPPTPMPYTRLGECLKILGWSVRYFARVRLKCDPAIVSRWALGTAPIPPTIAEWLERLAEDALANPPPDDWRVRVVRQAAE